LESQYRNAEQLLDSDIITREQLSTIEKRILELINTHLDEK